MDTRTLAMVAVAIALVTAGCGFLLGTEALVFSASEATVSEDAVTEAGYEETNVTEKNITREFSAAGQTREVTAVNQLAKYERAVELSPLDESRRAAMFTVFASPEVEVAGEAFNPIEDLSEREILNRFDSQYSGIEVGEQVGSRNVSSLGSERNVSKFTGTATLAGQDVDVYIHASKFKHEGDFIAVVAIYPQNVPGEEDRVVTMFEGLEHSGDN